MRRRKRFRRPSNLVSRSAVAGRSRPARVGPPGLRWVAGARAVRVNIDAGENVPGHSRVGCRAVNLGSFPFALWL
jgi:hypothetical protein